MRKILFVSLVLLAGAISGSGFANGWWESSAWISSMRLQVQQLETDFEGEFGVYVKDINSGEVFSYNGNQSWYLSSTVKVPVAIEVLRQSRKGFLKFSDEVTIQASDYRDGAGPVNWLKPGTRVTYMYLLEQMLTRSDNAATDLLIDKVGLDNLNKNTKNLVGRDFGRISTLLDVRRLAYSQFHPAALGLSNMDFFAIKKAKRADRKLKKLASLIGVLPAQLKYKNLSLGFESYYRTKWNTASLESYSRLLEKLAQGRVLSEAASRTVLDLMSRCQTGKNRIKKGLPKGMQFAHKTGTQHRRACDMGLATVGQGDKVKQVIIMVCTRRWRHLKKAELLMANIGKAVTKSGILTP